MSHATKKARQRRAMWRCTLACGHVAYSVVGEEHEVGRSRPCASCGPRPGAAVDQWVLILDSEQITVGIPEGEG